MADTTHPEQQKQDFGMVVKGICNGFRKYIRKKSGEEVTQLLINLPGATSSLQVEIPLGTNTARFKEFEPVTVKIMPSFYEGRIIGFNLA